jgi:hypothetical protein
MSGAAGSPIGAGRADTERTVTSRWRHDMKNQLGIVLGFAELLLGDAGHDYRRRQDLEDILTAARKAMLLVAELDEPHRT